VSTKVGGIPEVLPKNMIQLCQPDPKGEHRIRQVSLQPFYLLGFDFVSFSKNEDIFAAICRAVDGIDSVEPQKQHEAVKRMYDWNQVAERTERVYELISKTGKLPMLGRLRRYYECGSWIGKVICVLIALLFLWWKFLEWYVPRDEIDIAPDFPTSLLTVQQQKKQADSLTSSTDTNNSDTTKNNTVIPNIVISSDIDSSSSSSSSSSSASSSPILASSSSTDSFRSILP